MPFANREWIGQHDGGARTSLRHRGEGPLDASGRAGLHDFAPDPPRPRNVGDLLRPRACERVGRGSLGPRPAQARPAENLRGRSRSAGPRHPPCRLRERAERCLEPRQANANQERASTDRRAEFGHWMRPSLRPQAFSARPCVRCVVCVRLVSASSRAVLPRGQ